MKRTIFALAAALIALTATAQEENTRTMQVFYNGKMIYTRNVAYVDSINFLLENKHEGEGSGEGQESDSAQIYVGVVAFNKDTEQLPITSNLDNARMFINGLVNDMNFTSFAYAVSEGNKLFDAEGLPQFDKIFMLNFSDGTDNYSSTQWWYDGRTVSQGNVYDTARYDLMQREGLNSYALGFGNDAGFKNMMQKVVIGGGSYHNAASSTQLQPTFNEIAKSIIASAQNVELQTTPLSLINGDYKYFRFTFISLTEEGKIVRDTIIAQMEGALDSVFTLRVTEPGKYAQFDSPTRGTEDPTTGKVHIPLNNLKFIYEGDEIQFDFKVEISNDNGKSYYDDVEDSSIPESIIKRIAVVLVLDCSTSMGDAFEPMKEAAIDFIETLVKMDISQGGGGSAKFEDYTENLNGVEFKMVAVEGGFCVLGSQSANPELPNYDANSSLITRNAMIKDFYIGETEVTQELWEYVMGAHYASEFPAGAEKMYLDPAFDENCNLVETGGSMSCVYRSTPEYGDGDDYPVYLVSYNDITGEHGFLDRLNALTGKEYRLPTNNEWEYAARGGQKNQYTRETTDKDGNPSSAELYLYAGSNDIDEVAWYDGNSGGTTHRVKSKAPNDLGLYDMSGNVFEYVSNSEFHGGAFNDDETYCRLPEPYFWNDPDMDNIRGLTTGFRIVLVR